MKVAVQLARLIREVQIVVVEVDSVEKLTDRLSDVYEAAEGDPHDGNWTTDDAWGCDEGTHAIVGPAAEVPENSPVITLKQDA